MATITGTGVSPEILSRILNFLNSVETPEEITNLPDDPNFGYGDQVNDYDIGITVATRIIAKRDSLGGFTEISQLSDISGFGLDKFYDLVSAFAKFIKPIKSGVFRFLTVRNPKKITPTASAISYVSYPSALVAGSKVLPLISGTANAKTKAQAVPAPGGDTNPELNAAITRFKATTNYLHYENSNIISAPLTKLYDWIMANKYKMTLTSAAENTKGVKALSTTNKRKYWDSLLANILQNGSNADNQTIAGVLIADNFLAQSKNRDLIATNKDLRKLASATLVLPNEITGVLTPPESIDAPLPQAPVYEDTKGKVKEIQANISKYQNAIDNLKAVYELEKEKRRNIPPSNPYIGYQNPAQTEEGAPPPASKEQIPAPVSPGLLTSNTMNLLEKTTVSIIKEMGVPSGVRMSYAIERIDKKINDLTTQLWGKVSLSRRIVNVGGALWGETQGSEYQDYKTPAPPLESKYDDYHGFYHWYDRCRIKPIGVADLRRVEQELICYVPGEVAHIENILQGEYKERSTRRLRRSEETFSVTTEREEVNERDSVTTDRYEMEKETSKVIEKDLSFDLGVTASASYGPVKITVNSNFATSNSTVEADREAAFYAKDVTERSLQRIVERVREERTTKIIDEYEENNMHGLDNRLGDKHVVGLYRWADKIYKAQVVNYGKRLMLEFMIHEPAAFHLWAMTKPDASANTTLIEPLDPRSNAAAQEIGLSAPLNSATDISRANYALWASAYGANVDAPPPQYRRIGAAIQNSDQPIDEQTKRLATGILEDLQVPAGYNATDAFVTADFANTSVGNYDPSAIVYVANTGFWFSQSGGTRGATIARSIFHGDGILPVSYRANWTDSFICNIEVDCYLTDAALEDWRLKTYSAIIQAYEAKRAAFEIALAEAKVQRGVDIQGTNPALNRSIEQNELKKGCINWMYYGANFNSWAVWHYNDNNPCNPPVHNTDCTALQAGEKVQFLEQSFEWNLMTYNFYPYYYGNKCRWKKLYQLNDTDPLFLNFLQAGMARVIVPVRPGYEEAVMHFLKYRRVWNGGYLPAIDSPIYLSIVDELKEPVGVVEGDPWELRVPTTLTVLQCESGCVDGTGLPCAAGDGYGAGGAGILSGIDAAGVQTDGEHQHEDGEQGDGGHEDGGHH